MGALALATLEHHVEQQLEYDIKVFHEDDIPWQVQNDIHRLLNMAFKGKSMRFIAKTYAHVRPIERVICYKGLNPVAHIGIYSDTLHISNYSIKVACLGLWASLEANKILAAKVLAKALQYLKDQGYELGIGVSNSKVVLDHILPHHFEHAQLNVKVQGHNSISKSTDKTVFFPLNISKQAFDEIIEKASKVEVIQVDTEVF